MKSLIVTIEIPRFINENTSCMWRVVQMLWKSEYGDAFIIGWRACCLHQTLFLQGKPSSAWDKQTNAAAW